VLVATDRISAFDHVLATGIPGKGKILTLLDPCSGSPCWRICVQIT